MRTNICLTLPNDLAAWLDRYAEARHLPRSYAAQELLERCSRGELSDSYGVRVAAPAQSPLSQEA
jgi:predicted transcriptional regulator